MSEADQNQPVPQRLTSEEYKDLNDKYANLYAQVARLSTQAGTTSWTKGRVVAVTGGVVVTVAAISILSNKLWGMAFPQVEERTPARTPRAVSSM